MNYFIQQNIQINILKIGSVGNASVLQIGSAGLIRPSAHIYNSGGFTKPAPEPVKPGESMFGMPFVPTASLSPRNQNSKENNEIS